MSRGLKRGDDEIKATPDAYTGMLGISLLALVGAAVFLYLDYTKYPEGKPPSSIPGVNNEVPQGQPGQNPPAQNPPAQNPPGQNPPAQNPPGMNPPAQQGILLPPEVQ